jgi:GWxTD domain-containing protein
MSKVFLIYKSEKKAVGIAKPATLFVLLLLLCSGCVRTSWAAREPALPPLYAHWLNDEVKYLITNEERAAFLQQKTDADRDKFIEKFWLGRNPDPNAPMNKVKEDHYARLAYANEHFGTRNQQNGSITDRGMVYITLGPPQQVERHIETRELKPLEIWFYENGSGALPPHFYVVFYKQSAAEDYELYSPYGDRPQKLINSTNAINDDRAAIKIIRRDLNDEDAHIALSLIPGEPVDFDSPYASLQSDVLLNNIRDYRNLPRVKELLTAGQAAAEGVSHRLVLGEQFSDLSVIATRDGAKQSSINYLLRLRRPEDFTLTESSEGRYYYSLQFESKLTDGGGKVLFDRKQSLSDYLKEKQFLAVQGKCFGLEGRIPAASGKYQLTLSMTNLATKQSFVQSQTVLVPDFGDRIGVSQLFFAANQPPMRSASPLDPFSFSGVRLAPIGSENASVTQGTPLRAIYQVWAPAGSPVLLRGEKVKIHYLIGKLNSSERVEEDQEVDRGSFNEEGDLLMGKDLQTDTLAPGVYRLVVKVTDLKSASSAYQSLNFEVRDKAQPVAALWTVDVPEAN